MRSVAQPSSHPHTCVRVCVRVRVRVQPASIQHGRNDDELDTNFKQSASYMQTSGSEADSSDDSDEEENKKSKKAAKVSKKEAKKAVASSTSESDSGSDSDAPMPPAKGKQAAAAPTAAAAATASSKPNTSAPPVRAPAVPQKLVKAAPGEAPKQLTKQQINQIAAREKQKAEAAKKALLEGKPAPAAAAPKAQEDKKRKQPAAKSESDSSDSDSSDSDSNDGAAEPMSKAQKASAAATPASTAAAASSAAAAAPAKRPGQDLVDTTGMDEKTAKKAIVAAKQAARKLKADARRAEQEAAGTHPTQIDLQLMTRDNAANRLWELFEADRRDRGKPLTALESEELGRLPGKALAQLPNHETPEGHSFKLLYKGLKSMYGPNYQEQVCGGTIQPALSTKQERFSKKRDRAERKAAGDEGIEEEEEAEVRQKQNHIENPSIGAPYIVFITGSAIRAVEIGRAFKKIPMSVTHPHSDACKQATHSAAMRASSNPAMALRLGGKHRAGSVSRERENAEC